MLLPSTSYRSIYQTAVGKAALGVEIAAPTRPERLAALIWANARSTGFNPVPHALLALIAGPLTMRPDLVFQMGFALKF